MKENWKVIKGFSDYMASDLGNIKSLKKNKEVVLKKMIDSNGYYKVSLYENKKLHVVKIHQLIAKAFLNHETVKGLVVDHIDGDKLNNNLSNIQIITFRENISKAKTGSSQYTGVSKINITHIWSATIDINNKNVHLGRYKEEIEAHEAYQKALRNISLYNGDNNEFRKLLKQLP